MVWVCYVRVVRAGGVRVCRTPGIRIVRMRIRGKFTMDNKARSCSPRP